VATGFLSSLLLEIKADSTNRDSSEADSNRDNVSEQGECSGVSDNQINLNDNIINRVESDNQDNINQLDNQNNNQNGVNSGVNSLSSSLQLESNNNVGSETRVPKAKRRRRRRRGKRGSGSGQKEQKPTGSSGGENGGENSGNSGASQQTINSTSAKQSVQATTALKVVKPGDALSAPSARATSPLSTASMIKRKMRENDASLDQ
jgi:hypothetical protein